MNDQTELENFLVNDTIWIVNYLELFNSKNSHELEASLQYEE